MLVYVKVFWSDTRPKHRSLDVSLDKGPMAPSFPPCSGKATEQHPSRKHETKAFDRVSVCNAYPEPSKTDETRIRVSLKYIRQVNATIRISIRPPLVRHLRHRLDLAQPRKPSMKQELGSRYGRLDELL